MRQPTPWRRKQTGAWYAQVGGKQVRLADPTASKDDAWKALRAILGGSRPQTVPTATPTVAAVCGAFIARQEERQAAGEIEPATLEHYATLLGLAVLGLGRREAMSLAPEDVIRWAANQGDWGVNRQRAGVQAVRSAYRHAARTGLIPRDPLAGMRPPPAVPRDFDATAEVRGRLKSVATDEAWSHFLLALELSGCRPGEVAALTAKDFDPQAGTWLVPNKVRRATGQSHRTVYLPSTLVEVCKRLAQEHPTGPLFRNSQGGRWQRWSWGARMRRARKTLNLPPALVTYSLRHSFGTDAIAAGVNPIVAANLMGHQSTDMLMKVYAKIAQRRDTMREALQKFRGEGKPKRKR